MSTSPKVKTASDATFKRAGKYIDTALQPVIQKIIDRANEELRSKGIRIAADIRWAIDEVEPEGKNHEG